MNVLGSTSYGKVPKVFLGNKEEMQFHIHDFAKLKQEKGAYIVTENVKAHGHLWMLRIYPRGVAWSNTDNVDFSMFCEAEKSNSDPVVGKYMIRTKTSYGKEGKFGSRTGKRYAAFFFGELARTDVIENDCNDNGTLTISVDLEIATEKNPIWFPRLLTQGDNNNIGVQLYRSIETTSDVTFLVGSILKTKFKVHKSILAIRCKELYELVVTEEESSNHDDNEGETKAIFLPDFGELVFERLLEFIYMDKVPKLKENDTDVAKSILHAANRFGCTNLKLYIESVLVEKFLVPSNAIALLFLADSYSCALLKEAAMNMYASKFTDVMESSKEDWTRLKESNDLLVELLLHTNNPGGRKKYSSVVENDDGDTLEDVDDFDVTSLRERLEKANLDVDGSRQILVERWKTYLRPGNNDNENQSKRQRIE
ncbi:hypothetical protein FRACYDRAFT_249542 [Fragilariopsis cylindrus CCMP1102]|uniref:BTB domain-containing protein n=1 Tax=Fragilariopsis cylindrus CCMP1102 TaxID=635003 RepID=A0A1E7ES22_9STRA|nr:hypothetical protein FRACYDRAFT_249542 [Fragilariopsis cylindrus CCMP1102]|eukprot:OEU08646.1 hypothetical protein FRACYDRAFT_249542 [Fragilariopsis cylindrus CCMP1102]